MLSCGRRLSSRFHSPSLVQLQVAIMEVGMPQSVAATLHQALELPSKVKKTGTF